MFLAEPPAFDDLIRQLASAERTLNSPNRL